MANKHLEKHEQYFKNTIKYCEEMHEALTSKSQELDPENEAEGYIKFMVDSSATECLFRIRETNNIAKQLFGKDFDVKDSLIPLLNDLKPAFSLKGDKLINVSGMEFSEMVSYIKDAVAARNKNNAGGKDS
jgi:uncharacterized protein YcaQ|tara:strand:- start:2704 stop:3096 length:393 start_codon:yes stop_codon:yes gene_type:complete